MPDIYIGGAWVDVGLRFDKLNADMKSVPSKLAPLQAAATKGLREQTKLEDERLKKMRDLLGITQEIADTEATRVKNMSFVDRTMNAMGAKVNKAGMMGAQLSYAAQDFVTGLAMGNVNMAIMGASNNLGMMAMQISSAAAAWTTLGLVAIPLAITAFKAFNSEETRAKEAVEQLNAALERQRFGFKLNAIAREQLTDAEIKRMHGVGNLQGRVEGEARALQDLNDVLAEQQKLKERVEPVAQGLGANAGTVEAGDPLLKDIEKFHLGRKGLTPTERDRILRKLGLTRGFFDEGGRKEFEMRETPEGGIQVFRKAKKEERENAEKQLKDINSEIHEREEERDKRKANLEKLGKRRDAEARDELQFAQRSANARFNRYEQSKIQLERHERDERRQIRETYGDIKVGPAMTEKERAQREKEINDKALEDTDSTAKRMQAFRDQKLIHGRHLTDAEIKGFDDEKAQIEENRKKSQRELQKQFEAGEPTLADPMLKANAAKFQRQRIELAEQFANQGPPSKFVGIEQLAKEVQLGMGGGKSLDIAAQTADNTKGTQDAVRDLITAVNNLNLGVGP